MPSCARVIRSACLERLLHALLERTQLDAAFSCASRRRTLFNRTVHGFRNSCLNFAQRVIVIVQDRRDLVEGADNASLEVVQGTGVPGERPPHHLLNQLNSIVDQPRVARVDLANLAGAFESSADFRAQLRSFMQLEREGSRCRR